jgi:hypothetical protein
MKNGMIALVFAAFQAVSQGCLAAAAPVLNVPLLVSKADLIVVARLQPSQTKAEILDVIKGSPRGGEIKLRTFLQSEYGGTDTKTAILFLLQQGGENYRLLDSRGNFWSVSPTPIHVASQPDGPLAKVTAYLVGTLAVYFRPVCTSHGLMIVRPMPPKSVTLRVMIGAPRTRAIDASMQSIVPTGRPAFRPAANNVA